MKKTLVALAVLAASGASFAQVTITGNLTMGYQADTTGAVNSSADASGFGVDTSQINFAATEDLGGGMKATAKLSLAGADRSNESAAAGVNGSVTGRDASLALQTSVGVLTLATVKAADYLSGTFAGVGSYYSGWDGKVFGARSSRDTISYSLPIGAFTVTGTYQETANQVGLGGGTSGAAGTTGQSFSALSATYAAGKATAHAAFLSFNSNQATGAVKDQTRLSGNYDLGMAKLGAGVVVTNHTGGGLLNGGANPRITDMEVGANIPFGAAYLGASFVSRKIDDAETIGNASGTNTGYSLEVGYNLSKRTALIANYARWTQGAQVAGAGATFGVVANQQASNRTQILLSHSF